MLRLLLILLALMSGCTNQKDFRNGYEDHFVELHQGWQFREGDSPLNEKGEPEWSLDDDANHWRSFAFPDWAEVSKTSDNLIWQRTRLPEIKPGETLFIRGAWMLFEVYIEGERIYKYGNMDREGRGYFPGQSWHMITLQPEYSHKYISFRVFSLDRYVGIYDGVHLGERSAHLSWMVRRDLPLIVMGAVYVFIGLMMLVVFARDRSDLTNIAFAFFAISVGLYEFARTQIKDVLLFDPYFWGNFELTSLYVIPWFFCLFAESLVGSGPYKILRRIWQVDVLFVMFVYLRVFVKQDSLWLFLNPFQIFFLASSVLILAVIGREAWKGQLEARIFFTGVVFMILAASHDVLSSLGIISSNGLVNHVGLFLLILCLVVIVGRRYLRTISVKKNIELASAVQNLLLPKHRTGSFGGLVYSSFYKPQGKMSGDWMNFWQVGEDEQRLIFGDVVGKGPRAALAVAAISAFIENAKEAGESMEQCIIRINSGLCKLFSFHITSTLTAISVRSDGSIRLFNCGGVGWMRVSDASNAVPMPSSMLGLDLVPTLAIKDVTLEVGEGLCAFSDGILEGGRALKKLTRNLTKLHDAAYSCEDLIQTVLETSSSTKDDMSMLVVIKPRLDVKQQDDSQTA